VASSATVFFIRLPDLIGVIAEMAGKNQKEKGKEQLYVQSGCKRNFSP
jgi:hypothetical protein